MLLFRNTEGIGIWIWSSVLRKRKLMNGKPGRKHRNQGCVLQDEVMVERGECVEYTNPDNRIAKPRVKTRHRRSRVVRHYGQNRYRPSAKQGQWMPFKPGSENGCERNREQQHIERHLYRRSRGVHPWHGFDRLRPCLDRPPQQTDHD